ncbi:MAG: ethanolamine utilization protein EutJ [Desulforhabdus sp.]|jgi:ethanolamine utilization protein EutJ|nr:ethanolamine utilization protein EutJ [Desulforhabdus sp.]
MPVSRSANQLLAAFEASLKLNGDAPFAAPLFAGVDLGTAYTVTAVVNADGEPVAGAMARSRSSIRDGLVLDYMGAISVLREQVKVLHQAGFPIESAAAAYPPGTIGRNAQTFANVLEAAGLRAVGLFDEPSAASLVLGILDGAVVDIGGGTTGISVLQNGQVIYVADEATGGIHLDLVIAGHYRIDTDEAEQIKTNPERQAEIFPLVRPVFQKMASIVKHHLREHSVSDLYLVGGTSCFPGIQEVMENETGLIIERPFNPLLVTPLGIALSCRNSMIAAN